MEADGSRDARWLPGCEKCESGTLVPLSDYSHEGAMILFKAWGCVNPLCGFSLRIDKGEVSYGEKILAKPARRVG